MKSSLFHKNNHEPDAISTISTCLFEVSRLFVWGAFICTTYLHSRLCFYVKVEPALSAGLAWMYTKQVASSGRPSFKFLSTYSAKKHGTHHSWLLGHSWGKICIFNLSKFTKEKNLISEFLVGTTNPYASWIYWSWLERCSIQMWTCPWLRQVWMD